MADGSLGQDDIDKLIAEMDGGGSQPAAAAPAPTPAPAPAPAPAPEAPAPAAAAGDGLLDQDAIDALINQVGEVTSKSATKAVAGASSSGGGHLDQGEIDKLLAELNPQTRRHAAASTASGHLDQKEIDRLLTELEVPASAGSGSEIAPATRTSSKSAPAATAAAPASKPGTAAVAAAPKSATSTVEGPLSQSDIDRLLADLGATQSKVGAEKVAAAPAATASATAATTEAEAIPAKRTVPSAPAPVTGSVSKPADATQALSADEIDAIVAKQTAGDGAASDSEAVIAQSDIDALVKQLAQATGTTEAEDVAAAIIGKESDIDRIQAEAAAPASPELTRDAVDVNSVLGRTASTATLRAEPVHVGNVTTIGTGEWRYAKWLLVAAVLLLGICSGALIILTASISGLSGELRAAREVEHPAVDGYAEKLRLALAKLEERDESERARGVRWMEELKRLHPDHAADVGIALARHFRRQGAWQRASDEYAAALEAAGGNDDPRVPLEHADCLTRLDDHAGAVRQVYLVLAAEGRWLAANDASGRPLPDLERNRQAVADAYLTLGRLLARTRDGAALAAVLPQAGPADAHGAAPAHAPAAGHAPAHAPAPAAGGGHH